MKVFQKQPRDSLDYDIDLSDWLYEDDRIQSVEIVEPPEGIEIGQIGYTENRAKVWINGGVSGESYKLTFLIYTDSRIKEVEMMMIVVDM